MKQILWSTPRAVFFLAILVLTGLAVRSYPTAAEGARALPPPAVDAPPGPAASAVVVSRRVLLGRAGRVPARQGVRSAVSGYAGDDKRLCGMRAREQGPDETRGISAGDPRSAPNQLWEAAQIFFSVATITELNR